MQWKERCLCVCVWLFCSMLLLICQLKQNVNKFVTCSNLWRQNTTLLLFFPVREIRYYPSIECMTFDMLSRLNIIEHQFTRIMLKTWKSELASLILFYNSIGLLHAFTGAFAVWGYSSSGLRMHWLPRACLWLRTQRPLGFENLRIPRWCFSVEKPPTWQWYTSNDPLFMVGLWILWTFSWKCPERGVWHKDVGYELYVERRTDIARHRVCIHQNWKVFFTLESSHDIIKHLCKPKNNPTKFRQSLTKFANFTAPKFFFAQWSVVFHSQTRPNETFRTLQSYIAPRGWGANLPKSQRSKQKPVFFDGQKSKKVLNFIHSESFLFFKGIWWNYKMNGPAQKICEVFRHFGCVFLLSCDW